MKLFAIKGLALSMIIAGTLSAGTVNQRRENQQDRIAQGVKSGQLTARETGRLENKEAGLNRQIRNDRRNDNGHLTTGERARVNHEQNHLSRDIYRDKHNAYRQ